MKLFSRSSGGEVSVLIDIGSASVLVAYIQTKTPKELPEILWSHREHIPLRQNAEVDQLAKNLLSALMNAAIELDTTGRKAAELAVPGHTYPNDIFVSVAAPWSYTINKTISYSTDEGFSVTNSLVDELEHTAATKTSEELEEQELAHSLGLTITIESTAAILANSYPIHTATGQHASSLAISRLSGVVQTFLVNTLKELRDKTFPKATLRIHPFMVAYYETLRSLEPSATEVGLVDVTYEASEIGIVRDGILQYCTHVAYGAFSIAREIAKKQDISTEEALGILQNPDELKGAPDQDQIDLYEKALIDLFKETGDRLSVPKTVFLHSPGSMYPFLEQRLVNAGKGATSGQIYVKPLTATLASNQPKSESHDTALLVSLWFFHTSKEKGIHEWH